MPTAAYYLGKRQIEAGEVERPQLSSGDVLIDVAFAGVCGSDLHLYHGFMDRRIHFPHIPGHEASGIVVEVAEDVTSVKPGDHVVVRPTVPCFECPACKAGFTHLCKNFRLLGIDLPGCFQETWKVPEFTIHKLPADMSLERSALVEPVAVACHVVQTIAQVREGEQVVIIGGGPIGLLISLVARHQGAEVTVAEISTPRINFARSLGLDTVNPKDTDLEELVQDRTGTAGVDAVFEVSGSQAGVNLMTRLLKARGRMIVVAMFHEPVTMDLGQVFYQELRMYGSRVYQAEDFEQSIALIHENKLPLNDFVTEIRPLTEAGSVFAELDERRDVMKILLQPGP